MKAFITLSLLLSSALAWPFDSLYDEMQSDQGSLDAETKIMLVKQKHILHLIDGVFDEISHEETKKLAESYVPMDHPKDFEHFEHVKHLMDHYNNHDKQILEKGHLFTLFDTYHRGGAIDLFKVFMTAKTWEAFYGSACWARKHLNEGQFVYALTAAVAHRKDLQGIKLPAPYEINPQLYVPSHVIHEAYAAKMKQEPVVIDMGFTGTKKNPEQRVAYFGEDFGLNAHHYHWHIDFPFWWKDEDFGEHIDRKGELFFYMHHQLTARFDAERLSNHLPVVHALDWMLPIDEGFSPKTTYRKEGEFPTRPDHMEFHDLPFLTKRDMINYEFRIRDAIAHGYAYDKEGHKVMLNETDGINVLGALIEASEYSIDPHFFGSLHNYGHLMLGKVTDPTGKFGLPPSVMEHFETATRDPAFFRLHKYIDEIFKEHKDLLHPYTEDEIHMKGVHVESIELTDVERSDHPNELVTFFDDFVLDLDHILEHSDKVPSVSVKAKAQRLNHDDFKYNIKVKSDKAQKAAVRIFLAPKYDSNHEEFDLHHQRWMAIEMDKFLVDLKAGDNKIERSSRDASVSVHDFQTLSEIMEETEDALALKSAPHYSKHHRHCGIPERLLVPKGDRLGMKFHLYVILSEYHGDHHDELHGSHSYCGRLGEKYPDDHAMGFPFDRSIHDEHLFQQENIGHVEITIKHDGYHKSH
uniref:Hemocyanin 2 n=1 Tax=Argulus foliaceus TaxID=509924 RepID=A0A0M7BH04_9CRUS|nr:hemocyanin 2 [Argulus foliaceus]